MRLVCPNCGAQYEVPSEVIPTGGRDVQCSSCGDTWFQRHPADVAAEPDPESAEAVEEPASDEKEPAAGEEVTPPPPPPVSDIEDEPAEAPAAEVAPAAGEADLAGAAAEEPTGEAAEDEDEDDEDSVAPAPPVAARVRPLDPKVKNVLREEAKREARVRTHQADVIESQPDLGLDEPGPASARAATLAAARERAARAAASTGAVEEAPASSSRRDLLPDIEEINSSLRTKGEKKAAPVQVSQESIQDHRRGFRIGFGLTLLATALLIMLYLKADAVVAAAPGTRDTVEAYVAVANQARFWLDGAVDGLVIWLNGMVGPGQ